jgi:flagellar biosynthesis component FlhA
MHPRIRSVLRKYIERFVPNLNVISQFDIASFARLKSLGIVEI